MFSEYASRFLAQSQSRLSFTGQNQSQNDRSPSRNRQRSTSRLGVGRGLLSRNNMPAPYQQTGSHFSRFPFASRGQAPSAPLFYSATEEFREEDDGEEHQREIADHYALQRSRRAFGPSHLSESSEDDDGVVGRSSDPEDIDRDRSSEEDEGYGRRRGQGIRSSWKGDRSRVEQRGRLSAESMAEHSKRGQDATQSARIGTLSRSKGSLVDVDISEDERSSIDAVEHAELDESETPAFSGFRSKAAHGIVRTSQDPDSAPSESGDERSRLHHKPRSVDGQSVMTTIAEQEEPALRPPVLQHDAFWKTMYWIGLGSMLGSAFLVWLHTEAPSRKNPIGDTIYTTLQASIHLLAIDTLIALIVAAAWLAMLRNFLRPITYLTVLAAPIILFSFFLWPFIISYKGNWKGSSVQDKAMRIFSFIPLLGAMVWTYLAIERRHSVERAMRILELSSKIISESSHLLFAGFVATITTVACFWLWLLMFTRVFLEGHMAKKLFVIDATTWMLGVFFAFMLLWTQMVISGIQRATTAATVSQWYFYRSSDTTSTTREVVIASFNHARDTLLGTICLSSLIALLIRAPLVLLPRRLVGIFALCFNNLTPEPVTKLTSPLTLTYAAIHSQPLSSAARGLSRLPLAPGASRALHANRLQADRADPDLAYRTAHLLLHSTKQIMTLALGLGAWVTTSRTVHTPGSTYTGSLYAYVVGLGAAIIGYAILGAVEGIVGGVVDALVVCWGSEVAAGRGAGRTFCREAREVFGGDDDLGRRLRWDVV